MNWSTRPHQHNLWSSERLHAMGIIRLLMMVTARRISICSTPAAPYKHMRIPIHVYSPPPFQHYRLSESHRTPFRFRLQTHLVMSVALHRLVVIKPEPVFLLGKSGDRQSYRCSYLRILATNDNCVLVKGRLTRYISSSPIS